MRYQELQPTRDLLNRKFKGRSLPNTDFTVKDFIIMPNEDHDRKTHERFVFAINNLGMPVHEIEEAIIGHPHLDIRIRFRNKEMQGFYSLEHLGFTNEYLENYRFE